MEPAGTLQRHWAVPLATHRCAQAAQINPVLARALQALRASDPRERASDFYASTDDLLYRVDLPEFRSLLEFIAASLQDSAAQANAGIWPSARHGLSLELLGVWFQIQNGAAFHDVHTHGNCSWSGVYYVQIDPLEQRRRHPQHGALNGATRFYSPLFPLLGGAYIDRGNAWLQDATFDHLPSAGDLLLFPAFLAHTALPYAGELDRIVVSFNAQIHAAGGDRVQRFADR